MASAELITPKGGVWQKLLTALAERLGDIVSNETLMQVSQQHNYARRIRELRAEGWQIKYSNRPPGYILLSTERLPKDPGAYVNLRLRTEVLERDNYTCQICGISANQPYSDGELARLEIDHIQPLAEGGKTEVDNLQTLCARCNAGKKSSIAYSSVNDDEVSFVVRLPRQLWKLLNDEAKRRGLKVRQLVADILTGFFQRS